MSPPCVLVVADPERIAELVAALSEPLTQGHADLLVSSGGDDTIDLFHARRPQVVVVTASLVTGDSRSLIEALRGAVPAAEVAFVVVGDDDGGPIRTALDAIDLEPDRFVTRPLSAKALRFAVSGAIDAVALVRGTPVRGASPAHEATEADPTRAALRARWEALADSIGDGVIDEPIEDEVPSVPVLIHPRRAPQSPIDDHTPPPTWKPGATPGPEWSGATPPRGVMTAIPAQVMSTMADGLAGGRAWPDPSHNPWSTPAGVGPASAPWSDPSARSRDASGPVGEKPPWEGEPSGPKRAPDAELLATGEWDRPPHLREKEPIDPRAATTYAAPGAPSAGASDAAGSPGVADASGASSTPAATALNAPNSNLLDALAAGGASPSPVEPARGSGPVEAAPVATPWDEPSAPSREPTMILSEDPVVEPVKTPAELSGASLRIPPEISGSHPIMTPAELSGALRVADKPDVTTPGVSPTLRPPAPSLTPPPLQMPTSSGEPLPPRAKTESGPPTFGERPARPRVTEPPPAVGRADTEDNWPAGSRPPAAEPPKPQVARTSTLDLSSRLSDEERARYLEEHDADSVVVAERGPDERWSDPVPLAELRDPRRDPHAPAIDELGLDDLDDDLGLEPAPAVLSDLAPPVRTKTIVPLSDPELGLPPRDPSKLRVDADPPGGRDFARQLRAKMSQMAQRLFQGADAPPPPVDLTPRHDHHTEIDLAALAEEPALGGGVTEIEARAAQRQADPRDPTTSPGSWDTHVRERGLADHGEVIRGVSDAAMLLARMFAHGSTGRISFRKDDVEKIVFFDQGRPVFAASNEPGDRMGELLVREGKITASQYERCQTHVAESGRRMGEILVDFGYLKRRELLPAVRRHVEDIVYSLFGWGAGHYQITVDPQPSAERIRLSRHPASLILEGIRRKLDRSTLERLVGPPSTVIEVPDRDKLGGIVNLADLAPEERASLAAFDGQGDLAHVARTALIDVADVLPLAWGLCVLGLATARRTDTEIPDESTALVGETDLAIDRERVRARWQLVTEADYFALLGVRRDATAFEIRRAYQAARRDFAADCFPQDLRRELAQELEDIAHVLDEAFRVLRDDRLRMTYLSNLVE